MKPSKTTTNTKPFVLPCGMSCTNPRTCLVAKECVEKKESQDGKEEDSTKD
jgi:hypothetical protein